MTRYGTAGLALLLCAVLFAAPARADDLIVIPKPQRLIDDCWEASRPDRESTAARARHGYEITIECLKQAILDQIPFFFPLGGPLNKVKTRQLLDRLDTTVEELMWPMYNRNTGCGNRMLGCGTMYLNADDWETADFLEHILKTMIRIREEDGRW